MFELNKIFHGDALENSRLLPDSYIDLVITSPPYNLGDRYKSSKNEGGKWKRSIQYETSDALSYDEYIYWQHELILEWWRAIKSTGAIFYNHRPRLKNGKLITRMELIPAEVNLRQIIIWKRPSGHNFNRGYFVPSYEWIFLLAKPDYEIAKGGAGFSDVWEMNPDINDHPAPFPIELPLRAIKASLYSNIVLDPFMGSGTTAVAAKMMNSDWIGFELSERYIEIAELRVARTDSLFPGKPFKRELRSKRERYSQSNFDYINT